jgi:uncharacterized protein
MSSQIPSAIRNQRYISLKTFRKNGLGVATPVWFGEDEGKLYVMTRSDMGKTKRIRNNSKVTVAPCTIRGRLTGRSFRPPRASFRHKNLRVAARRSIANIGWHAFPGFGEGRIRALRSRSDDRSADSSTESQIPRPLSQYCRRTAGDDCRLRRILPGASSSAFSRRLECIRACSFLGRELCCAQWG